MSSPVTLTDAAVLGELLLEEAQVNTETPGRTVVQQFEQRQRLPGVVVADSGKIVGLISRRQLYQALSQPYALDIFLRRPIRVFLDLNVHCQHPLVLQAQETVQGAVRQALSRPSQSLFEPIIVVLSHPRLPHLRSHFLLDFHTLMLAHSQIAAAANQTMRRQQQQLQQEQQKVNAYTTQLENQQQTIAERNRQLEHQQQHMAHQTQAIQALNQRFMQIGTLLSQEGKKAFQATFAGVNDICQHTDQILIAGQRLEAELVTIDETSKLIEQVSRQVHHLSVQATIFANHACSNHASQELEGFSYITEEISHLSHRTSEAGRQIKSLGDRFRSRIDTFQASAQDGTVTARSLIREIEHAAIALSELEHLVEQTEQAQQNERAATNSSRLTASVSADSADPPSYAQPLAGQIAWSPIHHDYPTPMAQ
ncbi:MAG: hypothetical protein AAFZ80_07285 [Cyanobacteria bacterium P01_A01_bin.105]